MTRTTLFLALAASAMLLSGARPAPAEEVTIAMDDLALVDEESTDEAHQALATDEHATEASSELAIEAYVDRVNPARVHPARVHPARVHPARVHPARVYPARVYYKAR